MSTVLGAERSGWSCGSGSVSYTFEGLKFSNVRTGIQLGGIRIGKEELTSTLETNFLRNSTDNPFYPTKGTRLTANDEFTGGPFGGDLNYHRHRYEGRAYLPSLHKRIATMDAVPSGPMFSMRKSSWRGDSAAAARALTVSAFGSCW